MDEIRTGDEPTVTRKRPRRTQAERSQDTRRRVCAATLDALADVGYQQISTSQIAALAKVSRGALTHQFPTRNDLLVAAFEFLVGQWREGYPFKTDAPLRLTIDEFIDTAWTVMFSTRRYVASLELMLAARLDDELGQRLRKVLSDWILERDERVIEILGASPGDKDAELFVQLNLCVLRGVAVHRSFDSDPYFAERIIAQWKTIARAHSPLGTDS